MNVFIVRQMTVGFLLAILLCVSVTRRGIADPPPPPTELPEIDDARISLPPSRKRANKEDGNATRGRRKSRKAIVSTGGSKSERAVLAALTWLGKHQLPDGGWSFDHQRSVECQGKCGNSGALGDGRHAATGLALLAYLGSGQTHEAGGCQREVQAGLDYLVKHIKDQPEGGSLSESGGTMYSHGIAAIALCEAYGQTKDEDLREPAQKVIDFICYAQDPVGGGWRYGPRQPGDTSITGWQFSALQSAYLAGLQVPAIAVERTASFLDSVQSQQGTGYGYTTPSDRPTTTAIGLLLRMYLGTPTDDLALRQGVARIAKQGPSQLNMYYNYYGTQVLRHVGGRPWKKWHTEIRDALLASQLTEGHEAGSWRFSNGDVGSDRGGRLYCTVMATLTLEVYYRHFTLHRKEAISKMANDE